MGQKVHPTGFRLGYIKTWNSRWYAKKAYVEWLHEDLQIRKYIKKKLYQAGIPRFDIAEPKTSRMYFLSHMTPV